MPALRAIRRLRSKCQGPLPHVRTVRRGHRAGHQVAHVRPLRGTLVKVARERSQRDFRRKKTIIVKRGKRYLAKARRP